MLQQAALITLATVVTATLYGGFFAGWGFLPRLIAVAVAASALAVTLAAFEIRTLLSVLVCAAGFAVTALVVVLPAAAHGGPSGTLRVGWRALTGGWASMLSIAAPAPDSPQMLMTPALVTWLAGFLAVMLALRTRSVLGPSAILVCALAVGLMFASNQASTHLVETCALLVLSLCLTLTRAEVPASRGPYSPLRAASHAGLVATVAGVGVIAALASQPLDAAQRFNPRVLLTTHLRLEQEPDPLSGVRQQLRLPKPRALFTVTITGGAAPASLIAAVALEDFDGSHWSSPDLFRVAGPVLAPGPAVAHALALTEHVTLGGLSGPYLPVVGRATRIDASFGSSALIGFDPDSGTLVAADTGFGGGSYTVFASTAFAEARPAGSGVAGAAAGGGSSFAPYLRLPTVPAPLTALAARIMAGARTPYAQLSALDDYLRSLPTNLDALAGNSYGTLLRLLTATTPQGEAGYADQHAAAFAILARIEHIPTRVIVGYRLPAPSAQTGGSRTYTVTTADSYAWTQAYFQDYGWIDFDPTNTSDTVALPSGAAAAPPSPISAPTATGSPGAGATPTEAASRFPSPEPTPVTVPGPGLRVGSVQLGWALSVLVLAVAVACTVIAGTTAVRRLIRRMRRRGGDPAAKVVGAWQEAVDRLADAGVAVDASLTALEFAARADRPAPARPTREHHALALAAPFLEKLAARATDAAFSDQPPSTADVDDAWMLEREISRALYRGRRTSYRVAHWTVLRPRRRAPVRR